MKKVIWIMNHYATEMLINEGGRHYWFAKYLQRAGYHPVIFSCNVKHSAQGGTYFDDPGLWHVHETKVGFPFVVIRSTPYHGNGLDRVKNMAVFAWNLVRAAREFAKRFGKPDIILASSVHPFTIYAGERIAKKFKVPCIAEVRDLWPESIFAYYPEKKKRWTTQLLYAGERYLYKKANAIIFTMEGGQAYIQEKGWDLSNGGPIDLRKVHWLCNGIDLEDREGQVAVKHFSDTDLDDPDMFKIVYTGSIRKANDVKSIVQCAEMMKREPIRFLIYGQGEEKASLEDYCRRNGIENVVFKGYIERNNVAAVLDRADLLLLNYAPQPSTMRFGGSQNKLFEYMAAGKPILSNARFGYCLISRYRCGVAKEFTASIEYASSVRHFMEMDKAAYDNLCINSRSAANDFDFKVLTDKLIQIVEEL